MMNPGVPCLVQSQNPRPSMGRWWEKSIPLIKQPNRWPAELAEPPGDGWTPPPATAPAAFSQRCRWGGTDGKPRQQSKLQYVLETLSACSLFVMSQQPRGSGTPSLPVLLPPCMRSISRKLAFVGLRGGGGAWRWSVSKTDVGHFLLCFGSE